MISNDADVAELVDARDLKACGATDPANNSCKTDEIEPAEMATAPAGLQNVSVKAALHSIRVKSPANSPIATMATILHDGLELLEQPEQWPGQHEMHRAVLARCARELELRKGAK